MPAQDPLTPPHHQRTRRLKRLLRLVPRRAVFHRYPVVGRFADAARKRAYLWSFKPRHVRPAVYFGSILALWPVMGLQLPLAFVLALAFRANVMVAGALQLITNPLSAAFVYYGTYRIGKTTLQSLGWNRSPSSAVGEVIVEPSEDTIMTDLSSFQDLTPDLRWTPSLGATVAALVVGGTLCGLVLGLVLDVVYRQGFAFRERHPPRKPS